MKMKRKGILLASAILGSVAIVSTGFAAWVITSPSVSTEAQGNIQVETVKDDRVSFQVDFVDSDKSVSFGSSTVLDTDTKWLSSPTGEVEDLTVSVTVKKTEGTVKDGTLTLTNFEVGTVQDGKFVAVQSFNAEYLSTGKTLIVLPTTGDSTKKTFTAEDTVLTFDFTFAWGTAFNQQNPYLYYNSFEEVADLGTDGVKNWKNGDVVFENFDALADDAVAKLGALETLLNGKSFKATLDYKAKTA